jgi:hypothetical protein
VGVSSSLLITDNDPAIAAFGRDLERARHTSYPLTFDLCRLTVAVAEPAQALDTLTADLGLGTLGANWIAIPRRIAAKLLTHLIASELAYPTDVVPSELAADLASRFLAFFPSETRYYTNGAVSGETAIYDLDGNEVLGWRSISEAELDNGVIALAADRIGIIWAEDSP